MVHFISLEGKCLETLFKGSRVSLWQTKLEGNHLVGKVTKAMFD